MGIYRESVVKYVEECVVGGVVEKSGKEWGNIRESS